MFCTIIREGAAYLKREAGGSVEAVEQIIRDQEAAHIQAEKDSLVAQVKANPDQVWSLFKDYCIMGDSRAVGFWYYEYLPQSNCFSDGGLTDPALAAEYVRQTGVDALAIAVGTAHGLYGKAPSIRFDRISECSAATDAALVLHGATGLADEDIKRAIRCGIVKINVFTELNIAAADAVRDILSFKKGISDALLPEREAIRRQALRVFSVTAPQ